MITIGDLVHYVLHNQRGQGFVGWTFEQLVGSMARGMDEATVLYSLGDDQKVNGVVLGRKDSEAKTIFIEGILTSSKSVLNKFASTFKRMYPDYILSADRHNCRVIYCDTKRFINKIINLT